MKAPKIGMENTVDPLFFISGHCLPLHVIIATECWLKDGLAHPQQQNDSK